MLEVARQHRPKDVVEIVDSEAGGVEDADSLSSLTCDNMQVWNARYVFTDSQDEFTAILEWHRLNCNENFIRAVQSSA